MRFGEVARQGVNALRTKSQEFKKRAQDMYGEGEGDEGDKAGTPPRRVTRKPARPQSELEIFRETLQSGEGYVFGDFLGMGHRLLLLSHDIHVGRLAGRHVPSSYRAVNVDGSMPRDDENLASPMYHFKAAFADDERLQYQIEDMSIYGNQIGVNIRSGRQDKVPNRLYRLAAYCLFEVDPNLEAVRLGASRAKVEESRRLAGMVIARSEFEPPQDPAATT